MRSIGKIRRILGAGLIVGAIVFALSPASAGPPSFEEEIEYGQGNSVRICVRASLKNRCWPVTFSS